MLLDRSRGDRRGGFTLIELLVVNMLMTLLVVLIAGAWRAFGPLCVEVIARSRIANEANVAASALYLESTNNPGGLPLGNVETIDGASIQFEYGKQVEGTWPHVVTYSLVPTLDDPNSSGQLVRSDGQSSMTIARHVESTVARNLGTPGQAEFTISFAYRGSRSQYTFVVHHQ